MRKIKNPYVEPLQKNLVFGYVSTQRVEGFHSKFKGRGKLSLKQKGWTLDQLFSYLDKQVEDYTRFTLKKIKKNVVEGGNVLDEVSERLKVELKKVHGCFISLNRGAKTYLAVEKVNRESRTFQ
eukprot:snap_masked-scaffold_9-processed-gene-1.19-mRNA-1 protein AED:1.00 eAED:1.00 QI:0/-1/0/0/-1/1/1/0/123